jgi:hypothetical protein
MIVKLFRLIQDVLEIGSFLFRNYHFFAVVGNMGDNCIAFRKEFVFSVALSQNVKSLVEAVFFG